MPSQLEVPTRHSPDEFEKLWTCQKLIRFWIDHPEWKSYDLIPILYKALHTGEIDRSRNKLSLAQVVRNSDSHLTGFPSNLLPDAPHVYLLLANFSDNLDSIMREKPKSMQKTIEDAAFAYYVFERIHPFPDGNGRLGRMIVKAVLKAGDVKDPIFHDPRWYGGKQSDHLQALEKVGETNNIAHLELFLASSLEGAYSERGRDFLKSKELHGIILKKKKESKINPPGKLLRDIWPGFGNLPLYGNIPA